MIQGSCHCTAVRWTFEGRPGGATYRPARVFPKAFRRGRAPTHPLDHGNRPARLGAKRMGKHGERSVLVLA